MSATQMEYTDDPGTRDSREWSRICANVGGNRRKQGDESEQC